MNLPARVKFLLSFLPIVAIAALSWCSNVFADDHPAAGCRRYRFRQPRGLPGFELSSWYALLAPAKTSPAIVDLLSKDTKGALADSCFVKQMQS